MPSGSDPRVDPAIQVMLKDMRFLLLDGLIKSGHPGVSLLAARTFAPLTWASCVESAALPLPPQEWNHPDRHIRASAGLLRSDLS